MEYKSLCSYWMYVGGLDGICIIIRTSVEAIFSVMSSRERLLSEEYYLDEWNSWVTFQGNKKKKFGLILILVSHNSHL